MNKKLKLILILTVGFIILVAAFLYLTSPGCLPFAPGIYQIFIVPLPKWKCILLNISGKKTF